jgi:hypothetical protein
MTWLMVGVLAAGCFGFKVLGYSLPESWLDRGVLPRLAALVTPTLLAALVLVNTVGGDREIVVDARLPGVCVAALLAWRRAPLVVVVLVASAVTALLRAL